MLTEDQQHHVRSILLEELNKNEDAYYKRLQLSKKIEIDKETKAEVQSIVNDFAWKKSSFYFIIATALSVLGPFLGFLGGYAGHYFIEAHTKTEIDNLVDSATAKVAEINNLSKAALIDAKFPPAIVCDFENNGTTDRRALYFYSINDSGVAEYRLENTGSSHSVNINSELDVTHRGSRHRNASFNINNETRFRCPANLKEIFDDGRALGFIPICDKMSEATEKISWSSFET